MPFKRFILLYADINNINIQFGTVAAVAWNSASINLTFGTAYKSFYNIQLTTQGKDHAVDSACYEEKTLTSIRVISGFQGGNNNGATVQWLAIGH